MLFNKEELHKGSSAVFVNFILWVFIKERHLILKWLKCLFLNQKSGRLHLWQGRRLHEGHESQRTLNLEISDLPVCCSLVNLDEIGSMEHQNCTFNIKTIDLMLKSWNCKGVAKVESHYQKPACAHAIYHINISPYESLILGLWPMIQGLYPCGLKEPGRHFTIMRSCLARGIIP